MIVARIMNMKKEIKKMADFMLFDDAINIHPY